MALYLDGQKIVSGGSGSGGHTIVDNEGVSLEQRTNLQFNGAYSEDNSTDDTTEVNVVREMTKAEFDLLSADEKVGFINITDITGGNDDRFQPVIYSTEEREIGVWADGRPWYQKTLHIIPENPVPSKTDTSIPLTGLSADAEILGFISVFGGYNGPNSYVSGWRMFTFDRTSTDYSVTAIRGYSKSSIIVWPGNDFSDFTTVDNRFREFYITVQYTKTTDTPGSGQWTPQGVPAHHYSTDEQVIGTWIDGSTLYEKTIDIAQYSVTAEDTQFTNLVAIANIDFLVSAEIHKLPPNVGQLLRFNVSNDYIQVASKTTINLSAFGNLPVTFRYTKSST